jgi:excinuclease ABC subunit C
MVPQIARVEAVACDSVHEAAWLERNLLERAKPRWNRIRGGLEVPVCIRLEHKASQPRIVLDHWPPADPGTETFGPYLGGTQGRLAVSALDRVLPLRYTGDRLDGGLRDLARIRGVGRADRAGFLATITAVLRRRPSETRAVREGLALLRDRAAANLAFELAAHIQQEIEAVDWIVAEQKVTLADPPPDHDIYGWAGGLLVRFRVRNGRLNGWGQRPSTFGAARRYLERTPAQWSTFAGRNAELARELLPPSGPIG